MNTLKLTLLFAAFVLTASFGYAQNTVYKDSITIPAQSIVNPTIYISDISGGGITKDILLEKPFLRAKDPNGFIDWKILSYRVVFVKNGIESVPIYVVGEEFPKEIKSAFQSALSDVIMEISEIRVESVAGVRDIQKPVVVRIK
jgi:hypothetical protein